MAIRRECEGGMLWVLFLLNGSDMVTAHFIKISKEERELQVVRVLFLWASQMVLFITRSFVIKMWSNSFRKI